MHLFYLREIKSSISWCSVCFLIPLMFLVEKKRKCCTNLNCYIIEFGWNLEFLRLRVLLEKQYAKSQIGSGRHEWSITQILHDHSWRPKHASLVNFTVSRFVSVSKVVSKKWTVIGNMPWMLGLQLYTLLWFISMNVYQLSSTIPIIELKVRRKAGCLTQP